MEDDKKLCPVHEICMANNGMSKRDWNILKMLVSFAIFFMLVAWGCHSFVVFYPFKTVEMVQPIEILNKNKRVPLGGTVMMKVVYRKYVDNPAISVRTLVKRENEQTVLIDSATIVSNNKRGEGITTELFAVGVNSIAVGKRCQVIFSITHTLYGFRPILKQFESEEFEIYNPDIGNIPPHEHVGN